LFLTSPRDDLPVVELLQAIPAAWGDYMRDQYGVFRANRKLYSADAVSADMFTESDPLMVYLVLRQQVQLIKENVESLRQEPNSGKVRDVETGLGLADVEARVRQFEELVLEGQLSEVLEGVIYQNPEQARRFLAIREAREEQELALLQAKSAAVERALDDYDVDQFAAEGAAGGFGVGGEDFLNRLITLGIQAGETTEEQEDDEEQVGFRQELTLKRLDYDMQAATVASNQRRLSALLDELDQSLRTPGQNASETSVSAQRASEQLNALVGSLESLFEVIDRLASRLDQLRFGESAQMINLGQVSAEPEWRSGRFTQAHVHWYLLSLVAVFLAAALLMLGLKLLLAWSRPESGR
jgi:hypothetical protein